MTMNGYIRLMMTDDVEFPMWANYAIGIFSFVFLVVAIVYMIRANSKNNNSLLTQIRSASECVARTSDYATQANLSLPQYFSRVSQLLASDPGQTGSAVGEMTYIVSELGKIKANYDQLYSEANRQYGIVNRTAGKLFGPETADLQTDKTKEAFSRLANDYMVMQRLEFNEQLYAAACGYVGRFRNQPAPRQF